MAGDDVDVTVRKYRLRTVWFGIVKPKPVRTAEEAVCRTHLRADNDGEDRSIRVGIGGWNFAAVAQRFILKGLTQAKEFAYAASHLTSIEINSTFYGSQKPQSFRKWASAVPDGFVFSVKGPRFATNRRVLAEAGDFIKRFLDSGVPELRDRFGPMLWQSAPTKKFDAADFGKFLELLPAKADGRALRHVVEVRHASFCTPEFIALARRFGIPIVFTDHATYPSLADATGNFIYARLQKGKESIPTATRRKRSRRGPAACRPGREARRQWICRRPTRHTRRKRPRRATSSPTLFTRENSRASGGHGADRAVEGDERGKAPHPSIKRLLAETGFSEKI